MTSSTAHASPESIGVPLLDLVAQHEALQAELEAAILGVVRSGKYILGPEVEALEREVAEYCGCGYGIGMSSGTDALLACLMAEEIGPGHEVIVPDYSFFATAGVVCRLGATPVFVDINADTFNISVEAAARAVTPRTRAIIPVHLFGQMAEMDPLLDLAREASLVVVEDAAQAIGAEYKGRRAGSLGHYGCLSFFPSKNLGGFGDGGMVVTNDERRAERLRILRAHGARPKYHHAVIGGNFRLDAIQAVGLRIKLRHLESWTQARQRNAARYESLLGGVQGLVLPAKAPYRRHVYNQFVVSTSGRDRLREELTRNTIGSEVYYPAPFHRQECFENLVPPGSSFPVSDKAAATSLAIPVSPEVRDAQVERVAEAVLKALRPGHAR